MPEKLKLSQRFINNLKPDSKTFEIQDLERPWLRVVVYPSGKIVLRIYKKPRGGRVPVKVTIADLKAVKWPAALRLAGDKLEALESGTYQSRRSLRHVTDRIDPEITLKQVLDLYLSTKPDLAQSTKDKYNRAVDHHMASWSNSPLRTISDLAVIHWYQKKSSNQPGAANHALVLLSTLTKFLNRLTRRQEDFEPLLNPAEAIDKRVEIKSRKDRWIKAKDMTKWLQAIEKLRARDEDDPVMADYLEFIQFTGLRRREAAGLHWPDVQLGKRTFITIKETKSKRPLKIPLSKHAASILRRAQKQERKTPFPVEEPKRAITNLREWSEIDNIDVHGLRRTFMNWAGMAGVEKLVVKRLVNHSTKGEDVTESSYLDVADADDPRLLAAVDKVAKLMLKGDNVVSLKQKAK